MATAGEARPGKRARRHGEGAGAGKSVDELPVMAARSDLVKHVRASPAVVVVGETGSGKTTQLPKILLQVRCTRWKAAPRILF